MIAAQYDQFGEPQQVVFAAAVTMPDPPPGMARLRMVRAPIHNHDLATIRGIYGTRPSLPAIGGSEMLGIVDAVAGDVTTVTTGARVVCITFGAWAEYALAPASMLIPLPNEIPDELACQLLAMPMSAVVLFDELRVGKGEWIAQNAANGAVGKLLERIAQNHGVNVLNLVRSTAAADELREAGTRHVIVTQGDWYAQARDVTAGQPVVRAIDSIAGSATQDLLHLLAPRGELIVFGALSGSPIKLDPGMMIASECTVRGFWMTAWTARASGEERRRVVETVFALALRGELRLPVRETLPLSDVKNALTLSEMPGRGGKILLKP